MGDLSEKFKNLEVSNELFKDVKFYVTGEVKNDVIALLTKGGADQSRYFSDFVTHLICGENPEETDIIDATDVYEVPALTPKWIVVCSQLNRLVSTKPYQFTRLQPFASKTFCLSKVKDDQESLWALITYLGGKVQLNLDQNCDYLITIDTTTSKYEKAMSLGPEKICIATPDWIMECAKNKSLVQPDLFHPRLIDWPKPSPPVHHESTTAITGFEESDPAEKEGGNDEVASSTQALLEKLKQRMPWNQPEPKTEQPSTSTKMKEIVPPNVVAPSFQQKQNEQMLTHQQILQKIQMSQSQSTKTTMSNIPQQMTPEQQQMVQNALQNIRSRRMSRQNLMSAQQNTAQMSFPQNLQQNLSQQGNLQTASPLQQSPVSQQGPRAVLHHVPQGQKLQFQQNANVNRNINRPTLQQLRGQLGTTQLQQQLLQQQQQRLNQQQSQNVLQRNQLTLQQQQLLQLQLQQDQIGRARQLFQQNQPQQVQSGGNQVVNTQHLTPNQLSQLQVRAQQQKLAQNHQISQLLAQRQTAHLGHRLPPDQLLQNQPQLVGQPVNQNQQIRMSNPNQQHLKLVQQQAQQTIQTATLQNQNVMDHSQMVQVDQQMGQMQQQQNQMGQVQMGNNQQGIVQNQGMVQNQQINQTMGQNQMNQNQQQLTQSLNQQMGQSPNRQLVQGNQQLLQSLTQNQQMNETLGQMSATRNLLQNPQNQVDQAQQQLTESPRQQLNLGLNHILNQQIGQGNMPAQQRLNPNQLINQQLSQVQMGQHQQIPQSPIAQGVNQQFGSIIQQQLQSQQLQSQQQQLQNQQQLQSQQQQLQNQQQLQSQQQQLQTQQQLQSQQQQQQLQSQQQQQLQSQQQQLQSQQQQQLQSQQQQQLQSQQQQQLQSQQQQQLQSQQQQQLQSQQQQQLQSQQQLQTQQQHQLQSQQQQILVNNPLGQVRQVVGTNQQIIQQFGQNQQPFAQVQQQTEAGGQIQQQMIGQQQFGLQAQQQARPHLQQQQLWSQQQVQGQPLNVQQGQRPQWQQGQGVQPRQFIHLDAQTHNQLQKMPPEQQALFIAGLQQKQRQLMLKQTQQRGSNHILIRGPVPAGLNPQQQMAWLQQQANKQGVLLPANLQQQTVGSTTMNQQPGPSVAAAGAAALNQAPGLSPIRRSAQDQKLKQLRLQQLQGEQLRKATAAPPLQQGQQAASRPLPQAAISEQQVPIQDPSVGQSQVLVNPKTKTALANMLSIGLQSGGSAVGAPAEPLPEPSAAGTLRLMTAQHNASLNANRGPIDLLSVQQQRRTLSGPSGSDIRPPAPQSLPVATKPVDQQQAIATKSSGGATSSQPLQHRPGPFYGHNPNLKLPAEKFFLGCVFVVVEVLDFLKEKMPNYKSVIEFLGGELESMYNQRVTHVLCMSQRHGTVMQAIRDGKRCVTLYWFDDCLINKQLIPPHEVLHLPKMYTDTYPCSKHLISTEGFVAQKKRRVEQMIYNTGAKYTDYFSKHNTLLVAASNKGNKFRKAKAWNIPIVNLQWLIDILVGNYSALNQMDNVIYQQFTGAPNFNFDPKVCPNLMHAWKMPINISQETYERVKKEVAEEEAKKKKEEQKSDEEEESEDDESMDIDEDQAGARCSSSEEEQYVPADADDAKVVQSPIPHPEYNFMFSGIVSDNLKRHVETVKNLGGTVTNDTAACTHLLMEKMERTIKLVLCIPRHIPILPIKWLKDSRTAGRFLDPNGYTFGKVSRFNTEFSCDINALLRKENRNKLFEGKTFWVTPQIYPNPKMVRWLIERSGGALEEVRRTTAQIESTNQTAPHTYFIITSKEDIHLVGDLIRKRKGKLKYICEPEFIFNAVMTQKISVDPWAVRV